MNAPIKHVILHGCEAIPTAWKTYRDGIRTESDRHKTAIDAVSTVDALAALTVNWPSRP